MFSRVGALDRRCALSGRVLGAVALAPGKSLELQLRLESVATANSTRALDCLPCDERAR